MEEPRSSHAIPGFLRERLKAAAAVPLERRGPDVAAFLETCQLQQELVEALDLPAAAARSVAVDERWTCVRALKFTRAH